MIGSCNGVSLIGAATAAIVEPGGTVKVGKWDLADA